VGLIGGNDLSLLLNDITLEVTRKCNFKCDYCFVNQSNSELTYDVGKKTIDFFFKNANEGNINLIFFGGEPLLKFKLIKQIISYSKKKLRSIKNSMNFIIVTNGSLFTKDIIKYCKNENVKFLLSLDGDKKSQNISRRFHDGRESFGIIMQHIPKLKPTIQNITISAVISPKNVQFLYDNVNFFLELGFKRINLTTADECSWSNRDLNMLNGQMKKISQLYIQKKRAQEEFMINFVDYFSCKLKRLADQKKPCSAGINSLGVSVEGDIYPCYRFIHCDKEKKYLLGNVLSESIKEYKLKDFLNFDAKYNQPCVRCKANDFCFGKCYADNYIANNNIGKPTLKSCIIKSILISNYKKIMKELN